MALFKRGSTGPFVEDIQAVLNVVAWSPPMRKLVVDGIYGDKTLKRLAEFQKKTSTFPPLNDDGIIGPLTMPHLVRAAFQQGLRLDEARPGSVAQVMRALTKEDELAAQAERERALVLRAARKLGLVDYTAQQATGSDDCGYFAAFVLHLTFKLRSRSAFSPTDVYKQRDGAITKIDPSFVGKPQIGQNTRYLKLNAATEYLKRLDLHGYQVRQLLGLSRMDQDDFVKFMLERMSNGASGVMVAAPGFGAGHWFAIIGVKIVTSELGSDDTNDVKGYPFFLVYDSSGRLPNKVRQAGFPAGKQLVWMGGAELQANLIDWLSRGVEAGFVSL